jgi:hypothetical protein
MAVTRLKHESQWSRARLTTGGSRRVGPLVVAAVLTAGCRSSVDASPTKLDGTESHEFEREDLDAAAGASDAVKAYCADAVSEAQRLGCESHVTDADIE